MRRLAPEPKFPPLAPRSAHALLDMPVHRGSVGGMALAAATLDDHSRFKPYVYRGKGYDQYDVEVVAVVAPPKPKKRKRRKPKPPRHVYQPPPPPEPKPLDIMDTSTWGNWRRQTKWVVQETEPEPEPVLAVAPKRAHSLSPSVGWQPTAGADIDAMLEEFDA